MSSNLPPQIFPQPPMPYGPPPPPPKSKSSVGMILLILGGVACLMLALCCGGIFAIGMFGTKVLSTQIAEDVRDNPVIREHIGEIQESELDFVASSAHDDEDTYIVRLKGTKGSGVLTAKTQSRDDGGEDVLSAELRLPDGRTVKVVEEK